MTLSVVLARYLGPRDFGLLSYSLAFIGIFAIIADLGLHGIVIREVVKSPHEQKSILGSAFLLLLFSGFCMYLISIGTICFLRPQDKLALEIIILLGISLPLKFTQISTFWFEAKVLSKYTIWCQCSVFIIFSLLKLTCLIIGKEFIVIVYLYCVESICSSLLVFIFFNKFLRISDLKPNLHYIKVLINYAWPLIISSISVMIYMKVDQIMLGQMINDDAVGQYSVAVRISEFWYCIPLILTSTFYPSIVETRKKCLITYNNLLQKLYDILFWLALSLAIMMTLLGDYLIIFLYGNLYTEASVILKIHIWAGIFVFMGNVSGKWFLAENLQRNYLYFQIFGAILNIVLNFFFIPVYSGVGCAFATLISYMCSTWLVSLFFRKFRRAIFFKWLNSLNIYRVIRLSFK